MQSTVFMDIMKAFDIVSHKLLMNKVYEYDLGRAAYGLINSHRFNRILRTWSNIEQVVKSNIEIMGCGVPQSKAALIHSLQSILTSYPTT